MPQKFVGTPILREFDRGPTQVAVILLQLPFETTEQRKRISRGTGESRENLVVVKSANLFRRMFNDGFAERNLPVAREDDAVFSANRENCSGTYQAFRRHERNL